MPSIFLAFTQRNETLKLRQPTTPILTTVHFLISPSHLYLLPSIPHTIYMLKADFKIFNQVSPPHPTGKGQKLHSKTQMAMSKPIMMVSIFASVFCISSAQSCKNYTFSNDTSFTSCKDLPVLEAHLHWNYDPSQKTIHVAYRAKQNPKGWIAWGINPTDSSMIGTQALVAFQDAKGKMKAYSTQITSYVPLMEPGPLSFPVSKLSAEYVKNEMIITAVLGPLMSNLTAYNIVWQAGNSVSDGIPEPHPFLEPNLTSLEMLDFLSV